jgi:hypothetical protein
MAVDLPPTGVQVLSGGLKRPTMSFCLHPFVHANVTSIEGLVGARRLGLPRLTIAVQCCRGDRCHRRWGGVCIGGRDSSSVPPHLTPATLADAAAQCNRLGLHLCNRSCAGEGCQFNHHPVYSTLPCALPAPSAPSFSVPRLAVRRVLRHPWRLTLAVHAARLVGRIPVLRRAYEECVYGLRLVFQVGPSELDRCHALCNQTCSCVGHRFDVKKTHLNLAALADGDRDLLCARSLPSNRMCSSPRRI